MNGAYLVAVIKQYHADQGVVFRLSSLLINRDNAEVIKLKNVITHLNLASNLQRPLLAYEIYKLACVIFSEDAYILAEPSLELFNKLRNMFTSEQQITFRIYNQSPLFSSDNFEDLLSHPKPLSLFRTIEKINNLYEARLTPDIIQIIKKHNSPEDALYAFCLLINNLIPLDAQKIILIEKSKDLLNDINSLIIHHQQSLRRQQIKPSGPVEEKRSIIQLPQIYHFLPSAPDLEEGIKVVETLPLMNFRF